MDANKPMTLLLIEDDVAECVKYKDCAKNRDDVRFVGMTSSGLDGINYVKMYAPEGVILDLELHHGKGSGIQFLQDLKTEKLEFRPLIIVATNSASHIVYNYVHEQGADLVYFKQQPDFSAEMVLNSMAALRRALHATIDEGYKNGGDGTESPAELQERIKSRISLEMDAIGIGPQLRGSVYLFDAIFELLVNGEQLESVLNVVGAKHGHAYSSVTRAMQTAINRAWKVTAIEDLQEHYKAKINYQTGVPTPTEFVYYYCNKIKRSL